MVWTHGAPLVKYVKDFFLKKKHLVHIWQQKTTRAHSLFKKKLNI
jgi:hypothetical protein